VVELALLLITRQARSPTEAAKKIWRRTGVHGGGWRSIWNKFKIDETGYVRKAKELLTLRRLVEIDAQVYSGVLQSWLNDLQNHLEILDAVSVEQILAGADETTKKRWPLIRDTVLAVERDIEKNNAGIFFHSEE
jgi:hypothetical protein